MPIDPSMNNNQDFRQLLEENTKLLRDIQATTERTRRYIFMGEIFSIVKILLIVVPVILGFVYLKPYFQTVVGSYQELLGAPSSSTGILQPKDILDELKKYQQGSGN